MFFMAKFYCESCGYSIEKNKKPERCPYCSSWGSMKQEETAEELIEEI